MNKKEFAADALALGSLAFYFIVFARALIGPYWLFVIQLLISALVLFIFSFVFKKSENHLARVIILTLFTVIFYDEIRFAVFALILFGLILCSALYLKKPIKSLVLGIFLGTTSALMGYLLAPLIAKYFNLG